MTGHIVGFFCAVLIQSTNRGCRIAAHLFNILMKLRQQIYITFITEHLGLCCDGFYLPKAPELDSTPWTPSNRLALLVLRCDLITSNLFHSFFRPVAASVRSAKLQRRDQRETYISPSPTIHIVCHIPNPILGVTPLYSPLIPLFP